MTREEYVRRVLVVMNEAGASGEEIPGGDGARVGDLVEGLFTDAWAVVARGLPLSLLPRVDFSGAAPVHDVASGTGHVLAPPGFFRLSAFRLKGWRRAATEAALEGGDTDRMQGNAFTRGGVTRPVVVLRGSLLWYYSLPPGRPAVVEEAFYVPLHGGLPVSGDIGVDPRAVEALCFANAGMAYVAAGNAAMGGALLEQSGALLPLLVN